MSVLIDFITCFTLIFGLFWLFIYYKQIKVINNFYKKIPGPPGIPLFGNVLDFKSKTKNVLDVFFDYCKKHGEIVKVQFGPLRKVLLVSDYKLIEFVLSSNKIISKSANYKKMIPWLGTGLLTSDGLKWKQHRKIITPTFHFKILEQFVSCFESSGNILIERLEKCVGRSSVNIYPFVTLYALDVICETAMGTTVNAQKNDKSNYVTSVKEMGRIIMERALVPHKNNDFLFSLSRDCQIQKQALKILHEYTNSVINNRKQKLLNELSQRITHNNTNIGEKKKVAFLDLLLQVTIGDKSLNHDEIREEVDTFMFEGHDTTASAISFALYSIANNPEVQKKAYEEQLGLFGVTKNPNVTYKDLQDMKYLELIIKEVLRLYPSVPIYSRETSEELTFGDLTIPKGVNIIIFAYGIHRNSKYFHDPEKFDPSRFENFVGNVPYAYIPFSAGPRNCIGQKFAILEIKSIVSKVIRNFELCPTTLQHPLRLVAETVLKSDNGVNIYVKPRP